MSAATDTGYVSSLCWAIQSQGSQMYADTLLASAIVYSTMMNATAWMGTPIDPNQMPGAVPNDNSQGYPMPKSDRNYTSQEIQAMIAYAAKQLAGKTGDDITKWQTCLQVWTNLNSQMDARKGIQTSSSNSASQSSSQMVQTDNSNIDGAVATSNSIMDAKNFGAGLLNGG